MGEISVLIFVFPFVCFLTVISRSCIYEWMGVLQPPNMGLPLLLLLLLSFRSALLTSIIINSCRAPRLLSLGYLTPCPLLRGGGKRAMR